MYRSALLPYQDGVLQRATLPGSGLYDSAPSACLLLLLSFVGRVYTTRGCRGCGVAGAAGRSACFCRWCVGPNPPASEQLAVLGVAAAAALRLPPPCTFSIGCETGDRQSDIVAFNRRVAVSNKVINALNLIITKLTKAIED